MKILRLVALLGVLFVTGCAGRPGPATGYLSEADSTSIAAGQKGGLRMTLFEPPQELSLYTYKTLIVARIDPATRRVKIRGSNGGIDRNAFGSLSFQGEGQPYTSAIALEPGNYAPVAFMIRVPSRPNFYTFNVNGTPVVANSGGVDSIEVLLNVYDAQAAPTFEEGKDTRSVLAQLVGPSFVQIKNTKAVERLKPENLHGLTLGKDVPLWTVTAGKTLDLGKNRFEVAEQEVDGFKCLYAKESYAAMAESDRWRNSSMTYTLLGRVDPSAPIDAQLRHALKVCPNRQTMQRSAYFVFHPVNSPFGQ
jgi:hypothetical protein